MTTGFREKRQPTKKEVQKENSDLKKDLDSLNTRLVKLETRFSSLIQEVQKTLEVYTMNFGQVLGSFKQAQTVMGLDVEKINYLTAAMKNILADKGFLEKELLTEAAESLRLKDFNEQSRLQDEQMGLVMHDGPVEKDTYVTFRLTSNYPTKIEDESGALVENTDPRAGSNFEPLCVYRSRSWIGQTPPELAETLEKNLMGMQEGEKKTFLWKIQNTEFPDIAGQLLECTLEVFEIRKGNLKIEQAQDSNNNSGATDGENQESNEVINELN